MKHTFDIDIFEGHLLFHYMGHIVLVDTGTLYSVSDCGSFEFVSDKYIVKDSFMDICVGYFSNILGCDFDVILGMDILSKYNININYKTKKITFSDDKLQIKDGVLVPLLSNPGEVICIPIKMNDRMTKCIIDTEAEISYINKSFIFDRKEHINVLDEDLLNSAHCILLVEIGNMAFSIKVGTLPNIIDSHLVGKDIDAILGYDLFDAFNVVFNWLDREMIVKCLK